MTEKIKADERLINLMLCLLQSKQPLSAAEIRYNPHIGYDTHAEDKSFERMFERDKQAIQELGFHLEVDRGYYRLDSSNSFIHTVELSNAELAYLRLLAQNYLSQQDFPYKDELRFALNKLNASIASCLSSDEEEKILFEESDDEWNESLSFAQPEKMTHSKKPDLLQELRRRIKKENARLLPAYKLQELINDAISKRKILCFHYRNMQGQRSEREVWPYFSYYHAGLWYFIAYDPHKSSIRTFRADNCSSMYLKNPHKKTPDFKASSLDFDSLIQLSFQYGDEQSYCASIIIPQSESWKASRITHDKGVLHEQENGDMCWQINCSDTDALIRFCLDAEAQLTPVHPPKLYQHYLHHLQQLQEVYHG